MIDSHGVSNMLRAHVHGIRDGRINLGRHWRVTHESAAACTIESDGAHGGVMGTEAMRVAIDRARVYGVGDLTEPWRSPLRIHRALYAFLSERQRGSGSLRRCRVRPWGRSSAQG